YLYPPDEVKAEFDKVTAAQTSIRTREYEANQEAARMLRDAGAEEFRIKQEAEAAAQEIRLLAQAEAENFEKQLAQYRQLAKDDPYILNAIWWNEMSRLFEGLRQNGNVEMLDQHLSGGGLDLIVPVPSKKK